MSISELLKSTIITNLELHGGCIILIILLFRNMRNSFFRNGRSNEFALYAIYVGSICMLLSDCIWTSMSLGGYTGNVAGYLVNLVYFISSSTASVSWFVFCSKQLGPELFQNRAVRGVTLVPYGILLFLYLLSPAYGFVFTIQSGAYVRGSFFYLDPLVKMGYIIAASAMAIRQGSKKEMGYLRWKDFDFALFAVPVIIGGILQTVTGVDFNCLGTTGGLVLIYILGITNPDTENTNALYSLANSFDASYIVNMDTGKIRSLHEDRMHEKSLPGMGSMDYATHFHSVLERILLPEDARNTLDAYELKNVAKRFEIDPSFSIRYRVKEASGQTAMHTASFIRAASEKGRNEFLLGINSIHMDSLLYERNEALMSKNQRLEQINLSIIESVAKIVEARDGGSGAHIVRVRKLTELLAQAVMADHPQYRLDDEKIKLISCASVLHDVGKIVIPDAILLKPGKLTKEEFEIMKTHSSKGCDILNMFPLGLDDAFLEIALSICRWHHEKYDGKGYPDGLKGEDIPIAAQIVAAADCFDALVSDRPYKKAFTPEKSFDMLVNGECGEFSPVIIDALNKQRNRLIELVRLFLP